MPSIEEMIDTRVGEVRIDSLDISFGEAISLHSNNELVIRPEYQRLFRWSPEQQSRLIESILLGLPIPQIFVIENEDGVLELIDGLQRLSSVIHFIEPALLTDHSSTEPLRLEGCDLITELNSKTYDDLPLRLKLSLKRSSVRMVIIKRQSNYFLRYEMFKRLNTGGSNLSAQEIRNCTARMIGDEGTNFYKFVVECASNEDFKICIDTLAETEKEQKGDEELVLRFLALKNGRQLFRGSVRDWLDDYMEKVILGRERLDLDQETQTFARLFSYINRILGGGAFVRYRLGEPIGALAPAYFEAVAMACLNVMGELTNQPNEVVRSKIIETVESADFRSYTGPSANTRSKLDGRITTVQDALRSLTNA